MLDNASGPSFCETNAAARFARSRAASAPDSVETVYWILEHLAANGRATVAGGLDPDSRWFSRKG